MRQHGILGALAGAALLGSLAISMQARAETMEELDALSEVAMDEQAGLETARQLASLGLYLDALSLIERVLGEHPTSASGMLMHAAYLCEIDDRQGGLVELGRLRDRDYGGQILAEARARCTNPAAAAAPVIPASAAGNANANTGNIKGGRN